MRKAFKFRLYPNRDQLRELESTLETHRRLYNDCLQQRISAFKEDGIRISYYDQTSWLTNQRKINPWFAKLNAASAGMTIRRLEFAFAGFFRRIKTKQKPGFPRFKSEGCFESVVYRGGDGIRLMPSDKLRIQHVGLIKCKVHRPIEGKVKTATIKRENGKWHIIFSCDLGEIIIPKSANPATGLDVGLESFYTTSEGVPEPNPSFLKTALPELRRVQRSLSRKKRGGKNHHKTKRKLGLLHTKVKNLRNDHGHKTSRKLVNRYGFIAVESLNIQNMLRNHRLSRAIADAGWAGFLAKLKHKAESAGVTVVEVDPRNTSQQCSGCGEIVKKILSVRTHKCPHCGLVLHRDVNAARNILAKALQARTEPVGANGKLLISVA